tara:strand:- start:3594 stop:4202 length:609 start_codon:yes stop_codon:yes gene_type:complete
MDAIAGELNMNDINKIETVIKKSIEVKTRTLEDKDLLNLIIDVVDLLKKCISSGNKLLIAGNGGSAADSQHMAAEFVSKFYFDRKALPAIALTTDTSILTSISNDYEYANIFARQIEAIGKSGDVFLAITTSGNSKNLIQASKIAKTMGVTVVGLTGNNGGLLKDFCDIVLDIKDDDTPRIQETHLLVEHIICELIELEYRN